MSSSVKWASVTAMAVVLASQAIGSASAAPSNDRQVCYKGVVGDREHRLVLDVKFHSPLNFGGGFPQTTYTALGKNVDRNAHTYTDTRMDVADGAIVVARKRGRYPYNFGAHLGVEAVGVLRGRKTVEFDCTSAEQSPTPHSWYCAVRKGGQDYGNDNYPIKFDLAYDELCGYFEDKAPSPAPQPH